MVFCLRPLPHRHPVLNLKTSGLDRTAFEVECSVTESRSRGSHGTALLSGFSCVKRGSQTALGRLPLGVPEDQRRQLWAFMLEGSVLTHGVATTVGPLPEAPPDPRAGTVAPPGGHTCCGRRANL